MKTKEENVRKKDKRPSERYKGEDCDVKLM